MLFKIPVQPDLLETDKLRNMKLIAQIVWLGLYLSIIPNSYCQSIKISSYGYTDSGKALQTALNSTNDTIIIDLQAQPVVLPPMRFYRLNNKVVVMEKGVEVRARPKAFPKTTDALFSFIDCHNIVILGNDGSLCMNKEEYLDGEWRHGISIRGSKDFVIKDLTIRDSGGDGVYIADSKTNVFSENILVDGVRAINNKRQGISIISGKNVRIKNCLLAETKGTLPGAGIDIEPNRSQDLVDEISISDCIIENNYGPGIKIALHNLTAESKDIMISVTNCVFGNNHSPENPRVASELVFDANKSSPVKGKVVLDSCLIESSKWGLLYSRKRADAYSVELKNFMALDMSKEGSMPIIYLEVTDYYRNEGPLGGFTLDDIYVESKTSIPLITIRGSRLGTLKSLKDFLANITYHGDMDPVEYIKYNPSFNDNVKLELTKKF